MGCFWSEHPLDKDFRFPTGQAMTIPGHWLTRLGRSQRSSVTAFGNPDTWTLNAKSGTGTVAPATRRLSGRHIGLSPNSISTKPLTKPYHWRQEIRALSLPREKHESASCSRNVGRGSRPRPGKFDRLRRVFDPPARTSA